MSASNEYVIGVCGHRHLPAELDSLLSLAGRVFVAPQGEPPVRGRGYCYRQAGIYVAKNCDILLAVWDGIELDTPDGAGTYETIKLAREFGRPIHRVSTTK